MRKFFISAALLSAAAVAAPASAQYGYDGGYYRDYRGGYDRDYRGYDRHYRGYDRNAEFQIERELERLHHRLDRSAERGLLSRGEVHSLTRQFDNLSRRFDSYRYNGLSGREYQDIQFRIANLSARLHEDRRDGRRYSRYSRY